MKEGLRLNLLEQIQSSFRITQRKKPPFFKKQVARDPVHPLSIWIRDPWHSIATVETLQRSFAGGMLSIVLHGGPKYRLPSMVSWRTRSLLSDF